MQNNKKKERPLYIAMIGQKNLGRNGGVEVVVRELACRLSSIGHKVTCYNRNITDDSVSTEKPEGLCIKSVPTIPYRGLAAVSSSLFAAICASFSGYDIVHFHAEGPAFMCWLPKLFGKSVVVTIHGLDWQRAKWGKIASFCIMQGERNAVKFADEIIVLSREAGRYFEEKYGRNTTYIPNGVNRPSIRNVSLIAEKFNLKKAEYLLYLGRLVPEKGLKYLLDAFKGVVTDKKLVVAGMASDTDDYVQEIKKLADSDKRILFTGFVQGKMLDELYSNSYLYILPSDLEGMPLSLLEAMSYGNCCLVSDIPECLEVIENRAFSFRKGDVEDLKEKIQFLCDNENIVEQYKKGISDYICTKYSWDKVTESTLALYRKI